MRESRLVSTTRQLVACALAAGIVQVTVAWAAWRPGSTGRTVAGPVRVIDGDTLDIGGVRVRLEGIDAPESGQRCKRRLIGRWACGTTATQMLEKLVAGGDVRCEERGTDKYGRVLGVCYAGTLDLNAAMVRRGMAWAFVRYSQTYVKEEAAARAERVGIWQAETQTAWDYRATRWSAAVPRAPEGCAIKGNVTKYGRIYHMPWSPWYAQIRIDPDKGKRWFCSEAEAIAAGWRPIETH